jgi:hypothetical protein
MTMKTLLYIALSCTAIQATAQCYPDRHNTSWNEGWLSCSTAPHPIAERPDGHWIKYDLGNTYRLSTVKLWNYNDPKRLNQGMRDFTIDYSTDGENWKQLGMYTLPKAPGTSTYEGEVVANFTGDTARFVVITVLNNWGGQCGGFAEVKFNVLEVTQTSQGQFTNDCFTASVFPNPHIESFQLSLSTRCKGAVQFAIYDHTGRMVSKGQMAPDQSYHHETVYTAHLAPGMYHLVAIQEGKVSRLPVIKIQR